MKHATIRSIIFDWKQTLYDPATDQLLPGTLPLLDYLTDCPCKLYLIGKGEAAMEQAATDLGVVPYFSDILFVGSEKLPSHFERYIDAVEPSATIVVGDKLSSEIALGNQLGATTIQVRQGKFATETAQNTFEKPDIIVQNLHELVPVLANYFEG